MDVFGMEHSIRKMWWSKLYSGHHKTVLSFYFKLAITSSTELMFQTLKISNIFDGRGHIIYANMKMDFPLEADDLINDDFAKTLKNFRNSKMLAHAFEYIYI